MAVNMTDVADARCLGLFRRANSTRHRTAGARRPVQKLLAQGQSIYRQGIAGNAAVPACASCHALSGAGLPPEFPRLAGQHEQYLVKQLERIPLGSAQQRSQPDDVHGGAQAVRRGHQSGGWVHRTDDIGAQRLRGRRECPPTSRFPSGAPMRPRANRLPARSYRSQTESRPILDATAHLQPNRPGIRLSRS